MFGRIDHEIKSDVECSDDETGENAVMGYGDSFWRVRWIPFTLFLGLTACYVSLSPGKVRGYGYIAEEMESGLRMLSVATARLKGLSVPPMVWSRHGPMPLLLDLPFLRIGKEFGDPDLALSFQPVLLTAALMTVVFLWLRKLCSPGASLFLVLAGAFGTMLWPYAYVGLETKQSLFVLLAGYMGLARGKIRGWPRVLIFAGVCALALTMKAVGVVLLPSIASLYYVQFRDDWRDRWGQLLASVSIILGLCAVNMVLRNFYWTPLGGGEAQFATWMIKSKFQIFTNIIGVLGSPAKGVFVFAPILVLSLWAIPKAFRAHRDVAVFAGLVLGCMLALLSVLISPFDETWGPRFMHVTIAPLLVCIGAAWPTVRWRSYVPIAALACMGVVISFLGAFFSYGARGQAIYDGRQNTMEWLTSDNVWNELAFDSQLFQVWWSGGSQPSLWTPAHIWVWTPPPDVPGWRTIDLNAYAEPQSHVFFYWNRPRDPYQEKLLRFYLICLAAGVLLLFRFVYAALAVSNRKENVRLAVLGVALTAALFAIGAGSLSSTERNIPKLLLDKSEVIAGRDAYTLSIPAMPNSTVEIRYSIDGAATEEMTLALDENGAIHLDVSSETRKGLYRMMAFKQRSEDRWWISDATITVK